MSHVPLTRTRSILLLLGILILSAFVYYRVSFNDFIWWDDPQHVTANPDIKHLTFDNIYRYFTTSYVSMYQPLVTLSFAVEYALAGPDPRLFHLTNLLFHLANVVLLFLLIQRLFHHHGIALFVALIFAIHPMHVESVAWVTERKDVLYAFFYFLALLNFLRFQDNNSPGFYWLSLGFFTLSLLSKSAAVTLPLLLLLLHWYRQQPWEKRLLLRYLPFFALALLFGIISLVTQKPQDNTIFYQTYSIVDRIFLSLYPIAFYIVKYFVPFNLSVFHSFPTKVNGLLPWEFYAAPVLIVLALLPVILRWKLQQLARFALGFFFLHIALYLHFFPVGSAVVAERYTYVAYIGLSILLAQTVTTYAQQIQWMKKVILPALGVVVLIFASISYHRVQPWNNTISLFQDALNKTGLNETTGNMLCLGYVSEGLKKLEQSDTLSALCCFDKGISYDPTYYGGYEQRGRLLIKLRRYPEAISDFTHAIENASHEINKAEFYDLRGLAYLRLQNYSAALTEFSTALSLDTTLARTYANRGIVSIHLKHFPEACRDFTRAIELGFTRAKPLYEQYCKGNGK